MKPDLGDKRKNGRAYELKPTSIMLKGRLLRVNDISSEGIGVVLEKDGPQFFIGERIEKIPIPLQSGTMDLKGTVSHISINVANTVLGIQFLFGEQDFDAIVRFKKERTL